MTKTLTEQWREGELFGLHYVKIPKEEVCIHNVSYMDYLLDEYGVEVLERVPSYDEHNELKQDNKYLKSGIETRDKQIEQLEKKLEIATKALKDCYNDMKYWAVLTHRNQRILSVIKKAIKEMEGAK